MAKKDKFEKTNAMRMLLMPAGFRTDITCATAQIALSGSQGVTLVF